MGRQRELVRTMMNETWPRIANQALGSHRDHVLDEDVYHMSDMYAL